MKLHIYREAFWDLFKTRNLLTNLSKFYGLEVGLALAENLIHKDCEAANMQGRYVVRKHNCCQFSFNISTYWQIEMLFFLGLKMKKLSDMLIQGMVMSRCIFFTIYI